MITRLGRTALYCYSVIMVVKVCISFVKGAEMVVEVGTEKKCCSLISENKFNQVITHFLSMRAPDMAPEGAD